MRFKDLRLTEDERNFLKKYQISVPSTLEFTKKEVESIEKQILNLVGKLKEDWDFAYKLGNEVHAQRHQWEDERDD